MLVGSWVWGERSISDGGRLVSGSGMGRGSGGGGIFGKLSVSFAGKKSSVPLVALASS